MMICQSGVEKMKKRFGLVSFLLSTATTMGATVETDNTLYYSSVSKGDDVKITTKDAQSLAPLKGYGIYLNNGSYSLNNVEISTSGSQSDAIRTNGGSSYIYAKNLKVSASGTHADAINMASSNADSRYTDLLLVQGNSELTSKSGVTVRVNNYFNENSKSVVILSGSSDITNTYALNATNASDTQGYAVYAGNRNKDTNNLGIKDILAGKNNNTKGKSYVFIGENSKIESNAKKGHAVYANKGGTIQLGDNVEITANGLDAYAIFASTEQQGTYVDNVRPGKVYLEGGAVLRVQNGTDVIQAKGKDSVIMSGYLDRPVIAENYTQGQEIDINDDVINQSSGKFDIVGRISAVEGGNVSLNMDTDSKFIGSTIIDEGENSEINLKFSGSNSTWIMDENSSLSSLELSDNSVLSFYKDLDSEILSYTLKGDVNNYGGVIDISSLNGSDFGTFIIDGNYNGKNGSIIFNTELDNDLSKTDKLVITGDTFGDTKVKVNNIGGTGAETLEGIELISVAGDSDGEFEKDGRIVAGAYEYFLNRGDGSKTDKKNWYLTSSLTPIIEPPVDPPIDPPVDPPTDPPELPVVTPPIKPPLEVPQESVDRPKIYRPEFGSYLANNAVVNTLFYHNLYDRLGEVQYTDTLSENDNVTSLWIRNAGRYNKFKDESKQLNTNGKTFVVQVGGDIAQWSTNDLNRYHFGVMGGYGFNHNNTSSKITDYKSKGESTGYNLGIYGTWFSNFEDRSGFYTDTWLMYNWFNNTVAGEELEEEKYSSKGITASIEGGYTFRIGENLEKKILFIQPKIQAVYMGVDTKDHTESNGTVVKFSGDGNIQTRLGMRVYTSDFNPRETDKKTFQPFAEATWIHNQKDFTVAMNGINDKQSGTKNLGEIKLGTEVKVSQNFDVWGSVSHQWGKDKYADTGINVGIKYRF
jgi:autotransporter family porin